MRKTWDIKIANDNAPEHFIARRRIYEAEGFSLKNGQYRQPISTTFTNIATSVQPDNLKEDSNSAISLKLTLSCWVLAILLMVTTFGLNFGTGSKAFASIALLWTGLWSSYITADYGHWRLSETSIVTSLIGLMGITTATANYFGLGLTLVDALILMTILPLIIGDLLKSRICILASICASLIWGVLNFTGLAETSSFVVLLPLICTAQIYMGTKIQSGMAITLAVITGYYWLASLTLTAWSADNLPLTFATAAVFIIGTAHHRSGKAAEDKLLTGSSVHIYAGWIVAMIGAIGFQYFWLNPELVQNSTATLSASGLSLWKGVIATSLVVIFSSAIIRYKHSQISLGGIFSLVATCAIIPMMLWVPSWPRAIMSAVSVTHAMPTIGVVMGAAISTAALGMAFNGIRRQSIIMMGMGITILLIQAYLLLKPELMTVDNSIIFVAGFIAALALSAFIAGSSLSHQAARPRLKHS